MGFFLAYLFGKSPLAWQPLCAGVLAIGAAGYGWGLFVKREKAIAVLTLAGLLYGIIYVGVVRVMADSKAQNIMGQAAQISSMIQKPLPVVCSPEVSYSTCFYIGHRLKRPLQRRPPQEGPYYLVAGDRQEHGINGPYRGRTEELVLWEMNRLNR